MSFLYCNLFLHSKQFQCSDQVNSYVSVISHIYFYFKVPVHSDISANSTILEQFRIQAHFNIPVNSHVSPISSILSYCNLLVHSPIPFHSPFPAYSNIPSPSSSLLPPHMRTKWTPKWHLRPDFIEPRPCSLNYLLFTALYLLFTCSLIMT